MQRLDGEFEDLPDAWVGESNFEQISVEDIDELVKLYSTARADYELKTKLAKEANAVCESLKAKIINILDSASKKNWQVDGVGRITRTTRYSPQVINKEDMIKHFQDKGHEEFLAFVSVNHMTLGSYVKQEKEANPDFSMPGVEMIEVPNISFTRSR